MTVLDLAEEELIFQHFYQCSTLLTSSMVCEHHGVSRSTAMTRERFVRQPLEEREQKAAQENKAGLLSKLLQTSSKRMPPNFKGILPSSHLYN